MTQTESERIINKHADRLLGIAVSLMLTDHGAKEAVGMRLRVTMNTMREMIKEIVEDCLGTITADPVTFPGPATKPPPVSPPPPAVPAKAGPGPVTHTGKRP